MYGWQAFLVLGTVALAFGCKSVSQTQYSATNSLLRGNPSQIRERLLAEIPIGTDRIEAERRVRSLGLELTPQFELGSDSDDSIRCQHTGRSGLFGEATSLIHIDCRDGVVADIFCEQIGID